MPVSCRVGAPSWIDMDELAGLRRTPADEARVVLRAEPGRR